MSALRISAVTVTLVAFADPPLLNSVGGHEPFALRAMVEVRTDDGLSGLDETYADEGTSVALARLHEQYLRCGLRNRDDTGYMRRVVPAYERKQPRW
ncbi:MAG: hypothetical protein ACRDPF_12080 [Streptosporangiaceae bacterium]